MILYYCPSQFSPPAPGRASGLDLDQDGKGKGVAVQGKGLVMLRKHAHGILVCVSA